jgi:hypothetical protein
VLVRKDLSHGQQIVQTSHVVAEYLLNNCCSTWKNETLVCLGVHSENCLERWASRVALLKLPFAVFREPDIGNQMTALAVEDNSGLFKDLKLA